MNPSLLSDLTDRLASISDTPALDASVLIGDIIKRPRTWVMAHPTLTLTGEQQNELNTALERLERGESFPYVLGHWEFFGLDFEVTPDVLIPRPETELLVEKAIVWLQASPERRTAADVGTGSGVIAVTLAMHVPDAYILATDISLPALQVAKRNADKFDLRSHIDFVNCDLLPSHTDPLPTDLHFDLICANLPYIPTETLRGLRVFEREPTIALDGGPDGLDLFRRLLQLASDWLAPNGLMLLEIEASLGMKALSLASDSFSHAEIELHQDLAGRDRLLEIQLHD
ncbi:MAG: peptide chain release factor N(5)-glutamine methyltransferase [Chloroflexota bacterium]